MASKMPYVKFANGYECPILGLGTWKSKPGEVVQAVKDAIDIGYRHIDCAFVYGNEPEVGEALAAKIKEGVVKREELFITSKLWNTFHRPDLVKPALMKTLQNLQLDYLDLYLVHWPQAYKEEGELFPTDSAGKIQFSDVDYLDTWKALEPLVGEGLVKSIGISNFNSKQIDRLLKSATVKPVVNQISNLAAPSYSVEKVNGGDLYNMHAGASSQSQNITQDMACAQVECHPYLTQKRLQQFCEARGIKLTAYSPLGSPDRPWAKPGEPQLMDDPKLKAVAERLGKTVAQVLIRYQIDRGNIVIPKSVNKSRIQSNYEVLQFKLSAEDVQLIDSFDCNGRFVPMTASLGHKYHPFENEEF